MNAHQDVSIQAWPTTSNGVHGSGRKSLSDQTMSAGIGRPVKAHTVTASRSLPKDSPIVSLMKIGLGRYLLASPLTICARTNSAVTRHTWNQSRELRMPDAGRITAVPNQAEHALTSLTEKGA